MKTARPRASAPTSAATSLRLHPGTARAFADNQVREAAECRGARRHRPPCTGRDGYRRNRAKETIIGSTATHDAAARRRRYRHQRRAITLNR